MTQSLLCYVVLLRLYRACILSLLSRPIQALFYHLTSNLYRYYIHSIMQHYIISCRYKLLYARSALSCCISPKQLDISSIQTVEVPYLKVDQLLVAQQQIKQICYYVCYYISLLFAGASLAIIQGVITGSGHSGHYDDRHATINTHTKHSALCNS